MIGAAAAGGSSQVLSIATLPAFGIRWLMPRLSGFIGRWPDLAIHYGRPICAGANCTFLFDERAMPVASGGLVKRLGLTGKQNVACAPLLHVIMRPHHWHDWFRHHGIAVANAYRGTRFDHFPMIIAAVVAGLGVALPPPFLIEELASGALKALSDLSIETDSRYYLALPDRNRHGEIAVFFQHRLLNQASARAAGHAAPA